MNPDELTKRLNEILPSDRSVVTDGGHNLGYPAMHMSVPGPAYYRLTADFGAVGMGLGVALGAAFGRPKVQSVVFVGDGGLCMVLGDLDTIAHYEIPIVVVVMNDRAYGAERHFLDLIGRPSRHALFTDIDFSAIAETLGIESVRVETFEQLEAVAPRLRAKRDRAILLDCRIDPKVRAHWLDDVMLKGRKRSSNSAPDI